ncbi:MAG: hypothetical protein HDR53_03995 [Treponema sp.]|nr:hypothetical protein [Treponema sp.]
MFDKEIKITGKHANYVTKLSSKFGNTTAKFFDRNVDVYIQASIIGFLFQNKKSIDGSSDDTAHIFRDQVLKCKQDLEFNMQVILLLDKEYEPDEAKRIDKAFRNFGKDKSDIELFESYVRGGIEILYEKLIENASTSDDYVQKLCVFTNEINERYNSKVDMIQLQNLLNK